MVSKLTKIVVILIVLTTEHCLANQKIIAVVQSYNSNFGWVQEVEKGIFSYKKGEQKFGVIPKKVFKDCKIFRYYMDAKKHQGDIDFLRATGLKIIKDIEKIKPAVTIICDDEALKYVTLPLLNNKDHHFVFLGINNDPIDYGVVKNYKKPEMNVTGLISEHPFFYSVKLATKIIPDYKDIFVFFDKSPSGRGILKNFNKEVDKLDVSIKSHFKRIIVSNDWDEWKYTISQNQDPKNLFFFGTFYTLRDIRGNYVSTKDVALWLSKNSKVPDITILTNHISEGFFMAISNPGFVHGYEASEKASKILQGIPIRDIPIEVPKRKAVHINLDKADRWNIEVPVGIIAMTKYFSELGY